MSKKLVSLAEFNDERHEVYHLSAIDQPPNGIACPACGFELHDTSPSVTLTSNPPQKHIHCNHCAYTGYRVS